MKPDSASPPRERPEQERPANPGEILDRMTRETPEARPTLAERLNDLELIIQQQLKGLDATFHGGALETIRQLRERIAAEVRGYANAYVSAEEIADRILDQLSVPAQPAPPRFRHDCPCGEGSYPGHPPGWCRQTALCDDHAQVEPCPECARLDAEFPRPAEVEGLRERIAREVAAGAHYGLQLVRNRDPLPGEHTPEPCMSCQVTAENIIAAALSALPAPATNNPYRKMHGDHSLHSTHPMTFSAAPAREPLTVAAQWIRSHSAPDLAAKAGPTEKTMVDTKLGSEWGDGFIMGVHTVLYAMENEARIGTAPPQQHLVCPEDGRPETEARFAGKKVCDHCGTPLVAAPQQEPVAGILDFVEGYAGTRGRPYSTPDGRPYWMGWRHAVGMVRAQLRAASGERAPDTQECTGIAALWCPIHGDCTCPPDDQFPQEPSMVGPGCALHDPKSDHGERAPAQTGEPRADAIATVREIVRRHFKDVRSYSDDELRDFFHATPASEPAPSAGEQP